MSASEFASFVLSTSGLHPEAHNDGSSRQVAYSPPQIPFEHSTAPGHCAVSPHVSPSCRTGRGLQAFRKQLSRDWYIGALSPGRPVCQRVSLLTTRGTLVVLSAVGPCSATNIRGASDISGTLVVCATRSTNRCGGFRCTRSLKAKIWKRREPNLSAWHPLKAELS